MLCGVVGILIFFNRKPTDNQTDKPTENQIDQQIDTTQTLKACEHVTAAMNTDLKGIDPGEKTHTATIGISRFFNAIHETLTAFDKEKTHPKVASEWKEEGNAVIFTLRDDVVFSNGKKLTAKDIKFSFERAKNKGHDEYKLIKNIKILEDGRKLKIEFESMPVFLMQAISKLIILNKEAIEVNEKEGLKVGAGPFKFKEWIAEDKIELELNDNYYDKQIIKDSPKKITLKVVRDPSTALLQLGEGSIDVIFDFPIDQIENARRQGATVVENQTAKCSYLFMNEKKTNLKTRKLIAAALDIPKIIEDLGLPVTPLKAFVPSTSIAHNPDIKYHCDPNKMADVKTQIQALSEQEKTINFGFSAKEGEEVMNKIAEQLRTAGFIVTTHRPDFETFISNTLGAKTYNMSFFSEPHVEPFGHKAMLDLMEPDHGQGHTFLFEQNSEVTKLLDGIKGKLSQEDFVTKVKRLQQIFHDQVYVVPFYTQNTFFLTNNKIKNFNCDSLSKTDFTQIRESI